MRGHLKNRKPHLSAGALLVSCTLVLVACKQTPPVADAGADAAAAPSVQKDSAPAQTAKPAVSDRFREGMAFAQFREALVADGWLPLRDDTCFDKPSAEDNCDRYAEVQDCASPTKSGESVCNVRYATTQGNAIINAVIVGNKDDWRNVDGESALKLSSWKTTSAEKADSTRGVAPACPANEFDGFLKAFAADEGVERSFIAPLVKVAEIYADDNGDHSRLVYVPGDRYVDFNVRYDNGAYHYIDSENQVDKDTLDLKVEDADADSKAVSYLYGMSEGNSYRFEKREGCWLLTEDPQPPSP